MKRTLLIFLALMPIVSSAYYVGNGVVTTTTMQTVSVSAPIMTPMVAPMYTNVVYPSPVMNSGVVMGVPMVSPCQTQNNFYMAPQPVMMPMQRPVVFY